MMSLCLSACGCSREPPGYRAAASIAPPSAEEVPSRQPPRQAAGATRPARPPKNCNVVLLSIDSLRADMPWAGYPRPIAPRLTEFESQAVSFTRAYAISSYTSMSIGGLLGGRLPSELNRSGYFFGTYRGNIFFPQLLQKAGIRTMAIMAHLYFKSAGFEAGFDDWRLLPGITFDPNTDRDVTSAAHEELAEKVLGDPDNVSHRFFFWAHFLDPHDKYMSHPGIDWGKTARDRYDGEVTFTDSYVGKLIDFIHVQPWSSRTIVIVTSDHGEEFGEHNMTRHGFEIWETLVHVPLFVLAPGAKPGHIEALRSALDLAPTILDFFNLPPEPSFEGQSLVSEIYGGPVAERDVVVDLPMTSDNGRRRALLHGSEKLLCTDGDVYCKLYDILADPMERSPKKGPDVADMKARYSDIKRSIKEVAPYACGVDCLNGAYRKKQEGN